MTGEKVVELCAELNTFVDGRLNDDDAAAFLHYTNGVKGVLHATQIAAGEENRLSIRVYGERGGLEWHQMEPNTLIARWADRPTELIRTGNGYMCDLAKWNTRTPGGHPEGYIEAFANIYRNFAGTIRAKAKGETPSPESLDFPNVYDGVRGLQFIETMVASNQSKEWIKWMSE